MSEIAAWQTARERLVYRYLTALQEQDIDTVLDVLAKAEKDAVLEKMLWQLHDEQAQEGFSLAECAASTEPAPKERQPVQQEHTNQQSDQRRRRVPTKTRRVSRVLQTLVAAITVCVLVGSFLFVLEARRTSGVGSRPPSSNCFVSVPGPQIHGWLVGVATVKENDVWAVGGQYEDNRNAPHTLIEHWNGQRWQIVSSPNANGVSNTLTSITAISTTDVWAVGQTVVQSSSPVAQTQTLIEHWDGQRWQIVPSQNVILQATNTLTSVTAVSANDVWAVGLVDLVTSQSGTPRTQPLIEHWDGQDWHIVPSANVGATGGSLFSVAAISKDNVWAVGSDIEHWNGHTWSVVASPTIAGSLTGISAAGANDLWSVSNVGAIEHWDGQRWQLVTGTSHQVLNAVLALAPNNVWVAGSLQKGSTKSDTLLEHWNGQRWNVVPSPDPGPSQQRENDLHAIAATSAGTIWVVGAQQVGQGASAPLIIISTCL